MSKQGYAAESDPPEGARPARDTGVRLPLIAWSQVPEAFCDCFIAALRGRWAAEKERDAALQERDAARRERDEAQQELAACTRDCQRLNARVEPLMEERDEALALLRAETERANHLADALHGSYGTERRWRDAYDQTARERDEARAAARDYLPHVKFSYDDLNRGKRYERAERERLPWLGPPETPLEEL